MSDKITLQDILILNKDIRDIVNSLETKLDKQLETIDSRLTILEQFKIQAFLIFSGLIFVMTLAKDYILEKLGLKC